MLKKISLKNRCQHKDISLELGPGLTVVVGPQGSGKTNLLLMALSAVAGDNPLYGKKQDNVTRSVADKSPSYVDLWWEGEHSIYLRRGYQYCKSQLAVDGEEKSELRRDTDITAEVLRLLRLDKDSLWSFSFVQQGETSKLIRERPTDRLRFVADLLDQQWLLEISKDVEKSLNIVEGKLSTDELTQLKQALVKRAEHRQRYVNTSWEEYNNQQALNEVAVKLEAEKELQKKNETLNDLLTQSSQISVDWNSVQTEIKSVESWLEDAREQHRQSSHLLTLALSNQRSLEAAAYEQTSKQYLESVEHDLLHLTTQAEVDEVCRLESHLAQADENISRLQKNLKVYDKSVSAWETELERCRGSMELVQRQERNLELENWIAEAWSQCRWQEKRLVPPTPPDREKMDEEYYNELFTALTRIKARIQMIESGRSVCETCGTEVAPVEGELDRLRQERVDKEQRLSQERELISQWESYLAAVQQHQAELPANRRSLEFNRKKIEEYRAQLVSLDTAEVEAARQDVHRLQEAEQAFEYWKGKQLAVGGHLQAAQQARPGLVEFVEKARERLQEKEKLNESKRASLLASKTRLEKQLAEIAAYEIPEGLDPQLTVEDYRKQEQTRSAQVNDLTQKSSVLSSRAEQLQQSANELSERIKELRQQLKSFDPQQVGRLQSSYDELNYRLQESKTAKAVSHADWVRSKEVVTGLVARVRENRKLYRGKEALEQLRDLVHPRQLPRRVLRRLMLSIAQSLSELCRELGQPFEISIGEDLEFLVKHTDGSLEAAQRLSGGQQACVATVFWIVRLLANMGSGLPLLVLDEPTANMDEEAVSRFAEMLQRLGPVLIQRKLQVVVVTHHRQLIGCGQYVVDLGEADGSA